MRRILFQWRGVKVHAYPALLFVGIVAGVVAGTYAAASRGLEPARTYAAMLLLVVPALVGARLLYVAANWRALRREERRVFRPSGGGAALYGGLILSLLISWPLLSALAVPIGAFWDAATITLLVGMILTRVGCLLNGCCAGRPASGPLALFLPDVHGVWCRRLPSQLFEAGVAVTLLVATLVAWDHRPFEGAIFLANVAAYGMARCVLESTRATGGGGSESVWNRGIALASAAIALGILVLLVQSEAANGWRPPEPVVESLGVMNAWYFLLAPVAVLIVLLLFGFIGCIFDTSGLAFDLTYTQAVTADDPAGWWRLQETNPPTSPDGGTAQDQKGVRPGTYGRPATGFPPSPTTGSIGAPTPAILNLGVQPGLLATDLASRAIQVRGGFVRVPQGGGLFQGSFTLEVLVSVEWNLAQAGYLLPVLSCRDLGSVKKGFVLCAGPDPSNPQKYSWQFRAGTGTTTVPLTVKPKAPRPGDTGLNVVANTPTYLVLTYDANAAAFSFYYYHANRDWDWLTYILQFPAGAGPFLPPGPGADLLIGIDRPVPPITRVQATGTAPAGPSPAGVELTFAQPTTSGNLLVVAVTLNSGANNAVTPFLSDNYNNNWQLACRVQTIGSNPFSAEIWYAENSQGGANHKITVSPSINAYVAFAIAEYSGAATAGALDQTRTSYADFAHPSTALSTGNVNTTMAGGLYVGAAQWGGVNLPVTTEPGWTNVYTSTPTATAAAISVETHGEGMVAAAGSYTATWMLNSAHPWAACLAVFRPAPPTVFQGKIAEVAVYDKVLSEGRIATHGLAAFTG